MNREEAIKELKLIAKVTVWNNRREAVDMAIEALSEETYKRIITVPITRPNRKPTLCCPKCGYAADKRWNYCQHCGIRFIPEK